MRLENPSAFLPERPTPESWLAFVTIGLIGLFLSTGTFASMLMDGVPVSHRLIGLFLVGLGLGSAYFDARGLDENEVTA